MKPLTDLRIFTLFNQKTERNGSREKEVKSRATG
jgi:hypothetical protein